MLIWSANIDTDLVQLGFGGLLGNNYWSSTEYLPTQDGAAWYEFFVSGGSGPRSVGKNIGIAVRCSRALTL